MNAKLGKSVINLLLVALIVVPLNGVMAMTNAKLSVNDTQLAMNTVSHGGASLLTMTEPACEHCSKNNCHEKHQCSNGQCFASPGILLPAGTSYKHELSHMNSIEYRTGLIIPPLYAFFRPPR